MLTSELKVGVLFFIGLGLSIYFTFQLTEFRTAKGRYQVRFNHVSRVKDGDLVTYNGVKVGVITAVEAVIAGEGPDRHSEVLVKFSIDEARQDALLIDAATRFRINQGILGGATLEITSAHGEPITPERLKDLVGENPASLDEAIATVQRLVEENRAGVKSAIASADSGLRKFGNMSEEIQQTVAENRPGLKDAIGNIRDLVAENRPALKEAIASIRDAAAQAAKLLDENRAAINAAIVHFDEMTVQIRDLVAENRANVLATTAKLPQAVESFDGAAAQVRDLVAENRTGVKTTVDNLATASADVTQITADVKKATAQIASGKGTIGKLVFEDTVHDRAVGALSAVEQRAEEVKPLTAGLSDLKLYAGIDVGGNVTTGVTRTYAYLRVEPRSWKFYEGGVSYRTAPYGRDAMRDDPNKLNIDFNIALGWRFLPDDETQRYRLTVAAGMIDSQFGAWAESPVSERLTVRLMARRKDSQRDDNDRRFEEGETLVRFTARYRVWDRFYLTAGGDDMAGKPAVWGAFTAELLDNDLRNLTTAASLGR